jgi:hypothetical protein
MNASIISALAALVGAAIGGLTSVLASWLTQQTQAKAQWIAQERIHRQELYRDFIEQASNCYVDALQHGKPDISVLVAIYAKIGRMRVLSSPRVVESADRIGRKIVDTYWRRTRAFSNYKTCSTVTQSTFLATSAPPVALNSTCFVPSNSERSA